MSNQSKAEFNGGRNRGWARCGSLFVLTLSLQALAQAPDLTAAGAIAVLKANVNATPVYGETYNLGSTGLRGWIYIGGGTPYDGTLTVDSRQILVTVASTPGSAVMAVDDVILGAMAGSSGTVPVFTNDARKALGAAIGDAEKTGAGTLRVKRWRAGATIDVNISMAIMGDYAATAPYACPKSALILSNACNKLVSQLLADSNFLTVDYAGAVNGLALLAGVAPGHPDYATVQTRLQTFARSCASTTSLIDGGSTWHLGYVGLFLSEYYLVTSDSQVVTGLNNTIVKLARMQSRYGTYGHGGSLLKDDGSLHGTVPPYGPVNGCSVPANLAIVMGKKALVAAGQALDPEINPAIQRGSSFYGWYANKGGIPYGEHEPNFNNHSSAGKDAMCAIMFSIQTNRTAETEFFTRYALAGFNGLEYAHAGGQNFAFLWNALGANMGGELAVAEYLKQIRWHHNLVRRTDGSFAFEGQEQFGAGSTADGTYLGDSRGYDFQTTASYILTYSLPLKRLYITGKNFNPTNTLDASKITNAIAAGTFNLVCPSFSKANLIAALSAFDPMVRNAAAIELAKRSLTAGELTTLRGMVTGTDANGRMGACQALGLLNDTSALPSIVQRLNKTVESNVWVRAKAANAIRSYPSATMSTHRDAMLVAYAANATDPDVLVWDDPVQISNGYLSFALFGDAVYGGNDIASYTINAPKNLLYAAVKAGLKQPDSNPRSGVATFCKNDLTLQDVQALALDIFEVITTKSQADTMWSMDPQLTGLELLMKYKCAEALPIGLSLMDIKEGWAWGAAYYLSTILDTLVTFGDSARWIMPFLAEDINTLVPVLNPIDYDPTVPKILSTISTIDNAITSPSGLVYLLPLASNQVVAATGATNLTLTGSSCRTNAVTFSNVSTPAHGTLTGTAPNLTYTPNGGYTGPDHFTFRVVDNLTTSAPGSVSILVGTPGAGLKGEYYDNLDFTDLKLTRTNEQVNFAWGTGSPHASVGADTFSVRWSGLLQVPETGSYRFSTLNSDGVRLYINGNAAIDQFAVQEINWNDSGLFSLTEGQWVELHMDYYENTGSATAKLKWTGPSFAGSNGVIIGSQWLFDGAGMPRTPYAFAQSLTLLKNESKPVMLTASADVMTYSVVTLPAHGTLSGTAPSLTYTPTNNYIGLDSFTFKINNGTTDSVPATVSLDVIPANIFSVNFYADGGWTNLEAQDNLKVSTGMSAGLPDWFTYGWANVEVPWGLSEPQAPLALTSNRGSPANFVFKSCRNGGPYNSNTPRTTFLGDGNGNLMDGHVNSTLDGPYLFDMEVTDIPFAVYDVIFYIGATQAQFGDGTGVITFNGGADRAFTLKPGAFDGTFTEMVDATTQGNYIVYRYVTGSSFTAQTWGTGPDGFNHIGPCGFQIREVIVMSQTITFGALTPKTYGDAPFALTATASSGLTVSYASSDTNVATVAGAIVTIRKAGTTVITASQAGSGDYYAATNVLQTLTVNPRPVLLAGTRIYDGTAGIPVAGLSITNKVSGDDLTLSGSASLVGKDAGPQAVTNVTTFVTPARVRSATGAVGSSAATSFNATISAPAANNTLIAVISTRSSTASAVTGISNSGTALTWQRAVQTTPSTTTTTEIWYAPVVPGAGTTLTISLSASLFASAVVAEYSGVLTPSPVDKTATNSNAVASPTATTGTTATTDQGNEVWIGGIGLSRSSYTLTSILNSFSAVTNIASGSGTAGSNARTYFLEKIVTAPGTASSGGTVSTSSRWSGAIATFKAAPLSGLTLGGADAANYTLTGMNGTMTITPKALTLTGTTVTNKIYDATVTATLTNGALLAAEAPGAGTTSDGRRYTGDDIAVSQSGLFDTKDVGINKAVTSTSTLTGAQAGNYSLTQPAGLTGAITTAPLTVTASNQSKMFGATLTFGSGSTLFFSSGLQVGETIGSVTLVCTGGGAGAAIATYPITPSAVTGGIFTPSNYAITFADGTLTVNPAGQTITFGPLGAKTYGDAAFALTATASSGLEVSYSSSDPTVASVSGNLVTIHKGGTTTITATQAGNTNYTAATPVPQTLTVDKATPVIMWNVPGSIVYGTPLGALQLNATAGGVAGSFVYTPPAGTILSIGAHSLSVQFMPADTGTYNTPADKQVPISIGDTYLEEDFEDDWEDNALARTTNGWTSSALWDESSITNPAVGMARLPGNVLFPILYNHTAQRRLLRLKTEDVTLQTPTLSANFATLAVHIDMMVKFQVLEKSLSILTNNLDQKASIVLRASGATTNLVVYHGQKTDDGFGEPIITTLTERVDPDTWYRLTVTLDATTNNSGAEAFCVRINGKPLTSAAAYQDTWKTRIFSPTYSPDGGMWFLSCARRDGFSGTNLNCFTGVMFEGTGDIDDLVVTPLLPTFNLGTILQFVSSP